MSPMPTPTPDRLRRLLSMLNWLAQEGDASIDEMATRFDLTPSELVAELEMAACCGVPPYSPDQLLEIMVTDEGVVGRLGRSHARPRRMNSSEGFALAAACRALLAVPGSDPDGALSRALVKLDRALGDVKVTIDLDSPDYLGLLREALSTHRKVRIAYYSAAANEMSERTVVPHRIFTSEGHWYLDAWCEDVEDTRRFRLDRMATADLAATFDPSDPTALPGDGGAGDEVPVQAFVPGPDTRTVTIAADPATEWLFETIPAATRVSEDGDRRVWEVHVGGDAWLERLLLRLGPASAVVEPAEDASLAAKAATTILDRYRT